MGISKLDGLEKNLEKYLSKSDIEIFKYLYRCIKSKEISINTKLKYYNEFNQIIKLIKKRASIKTIK